MIGSRSRRAILIAIMLAPAIAAAQPRFRVVDLGAVTGSARSVALAVNDNNAVLVQDIDGHRVFIWRPGKQSPEKGSATEIKLPDAASINRMAFNDFGQIAFDRHGVFLWTPHDRGGSSGDVMQIQAEADGVRLTNGILLAADGTIVGWGFDVKGKTPVGIRWVPDLPNGTTGKAHLIADQKTGDRMSEPTAVNADGWVFGTCRFDANGWNLWKPDPANRLQGTLHRVAPASKDDSPGRFGVTAVNGRRIAGNFGNGSAWIFTLTDALHAEHQRDTHQAYIVGMDDAGDVIAASPGPGSYLVPPDGDMQILESVVENLPAGWRDINASAINRAGWIAGTAGDGKVTKTPTEIRSSVHACVLIPAAKR